MVWYCIGLSALHTFCVLSLNHVHFKIGNIVSLLSTDSPIQYHTMTRHYYSRNAE